MGKYKSNILLQVFSVIRVQNKIPCHLEIHQYYYRKMSFLAGSFFDIYATCTVALQCIIKLDAGHHILCASCETGKCT